MALKTISWAIFSKCILNLKNLFDNSFCNFPSTTCKIHVINHNNVAWVLFHFLGADFGDTVLAGLEINQGTKSEEEELTHAVNSMKKTTKEEKDENECRKSNSPMCHGCKNCTQNDESTGESDEEVQTKPCKKCGWNMDNSHSSDTSNKCCQCAYQSGDSQQVDITRTNKKTVFFERPGTKLGRNLCVVCKENKRSGLVYIYIFTY